MLNRLPHLQLNATVFGFGSRYIQKKVLMRFIRHVERDMAMLLRYKLFLPKYPRKAAHFRVSGSIIPVQCKPKI